MAIEPYLLTWRGNSAGPTWKSGNYTCYPIVSLNVPHPNRVAERRKRPTGESGPGPYFHTYKRPPDGVSAGYIYGSTLYVTEGSFREDIVIDRGNYADGHYVAEAFASGNYAYMFNYRSYPKGQGMMRWSELVSLTVLAVSEPFTDRKTETRFFGAKGGISYQSESSRAPILGFAYWERKIREEIRQTVQTAALATILHKSVDCYNYYKVLQQGYSIVADTPSISYKYAEEECFDWHTLTGALTHHCTSLASAAYIDAVDNLPGATCNSIATVIESMHSLARLFKGQPPKTPKNIKDLWLSYRYAISTTKADMDEYAETTRRLMALANASKISSIGQADDGKISCQATIVVDPSTCIPQDAKSWLKSYGFRLSALNAWDMVPFSFVVDWFLHIGDILECLENFGDALSMPVEQIWYSFRTSYDGQDTYFRVPGKVYFALPYVSYGETSNKTIGKRILDSIALFT